jgi:hypothetical protein
VSYWEAISAVAAGTGVGTVVVRGLVGDGFDNWVVVEGLSHMGSISHSDSVVGE